MSGDRHITTDLAQWIATALGGGTPSELVTRSRIAFIDTVGVILAGVNEPVTRVASTVVAADGCAPKASQIGTGYRTSAESAAFLNGVSGHALDFDDVSSSVVGHPSTVLIPAVLAAAEISGASGTDTLTAYIVGVEVMARLGLSIGSAHYARGWHATSTLGTIGAAAAAGRLLQLSPELMANALAIAVSESSGSRQNFGTMTKPFHAGHAARCGLHAARLAGAGMTGDINAFEGPSGFFALFSFERGDWSQLVPSLGNPWDLLVSGLSVKKYPCCFAIHRAADGILQLREEAGLRAATVRRVVVRAPRGAYAPLRRDQPTSGLEGKFSMRYAIAACLLDGHLGLQTFTNEAVRRPELGPLMDLIEVIEDPTIDGGPNPIEGGYVEVEVEASGRMLARRINEPVGSPRKPLSYKELLSKFRDCSYGVLGMQQSEHALMLLEKFESLPKVDELMGALGPGLSSTPGGVHY